MDSTKLLDELHDVGNSGYKDDYYKMNCVSTKDLVIATFMLQDRQDYVTSILKKVYSETCNGIYILRKIDNKELLDMLENRVTMEKTFRNSDFILKTYIDMSDNLQFETFEGLTFDGKFLPKKNEFFELKSRHILKYIEKIKREEKNMQYKSCKLGLMSVLYTPQKICNLDYNYPEVMIMPDDCENSIKRELLNLGYSINSYPLEIENYEEISFPKINLGVYKVNNWVLRKGDLLQCVR